MTDPDPEPTFDLGPVGVWTRQLDHQTMADAQASAAELEQLGFRTLWVPEVIGREPLTHAALLLSKTSELVVGVGVANIYARSPMVAQSAWKMLTEAFPERFVLGLGVSLPGFVEGIHHQTYGHPYTKMVEYLDAMESATFFATKPTSRLRLVLAAHRPRLMRLAAQRSLGAMTYFVPVEHTEWARETLGAGPKLLVEQAVVFERDPSTARAIAREYMATYLGMPTYTDRLRDFGWGDDDLSEPSDALVDAIVAWGSADDVVKRLRAQLDAGADHVAVQVLPAEARGVPMPEWRDLARATEGI